MTSRDREVDSTAERLAEFARLLTEEHDVEDILRRLGDYCTELLPVDAVGVLLRTEDDGLVLATANSEMGRRIEELEIELLEGPCTEALRIGEPVCVTDIADADDRYPRFAPAAVEVGARSISGIPMSVAGGAVGVLDLISSEPLDLHPDEALTAQLLADVAISYIQNSRLLADHSRLAAQLQTALDTRVPIEQAKGILAERHGITMDEAFERLRGHARSSQRRVREVAEEVVHGELRL